MGSKFLPGMGVGVVASMAVVAAVLWLPPHELGPAVRCTGAGICSVDVSLSGGLAPVCKITVAAETAMPLGVDPIAWTIRTPGYSFVAGGNGVVILNNSADFSPGAGSTATVFRLQRSSTVPPGRIYKYTLNIERNIGHAFCMVPTLPRIKND